MLFSRLILRPMLANRLRTLLTALGVMLGVAVMLAIQLANQGSLRGFSAALDAVSGKAALEITCPPLGLDETLIPQLSWLREIGIATPVIEADVTAQVAGQGGETLRIIGIDALRDPALRDYALAGESANAMQLMAFLAKPDSLIVTKHFADKHDLKADSKLLLLIGDRRREVTVAAIIGDDGAEKRGVQQTAMASQSLAVMDIANAQVALDRLGRVDRLEVRLHEGISIEKAEALLKSKLPASLTVQRPQRRSAAVEKMLAAFHFNLTTMPKSKAPPVPLDDEALARFRRAEGLARRSGGRTQLAGLRGVPRRHPGRNGPQLPGQPGRAERHQRGGGEEAGGLWARVVEGVGGVARCWALRHQQGAAWNARKLILQCLPRQRCVVAGLAAQPPAVAEAEVATQPQVGVGSDRAPAGHDLADALRRHANVLGQAVLGQPQGLQELFFEHFTRRNGRDGAHGSFPSVVVNDFDLGRALRSR